MEYHTHSKNLFTIVNRFLEWVRSYLQNRTFYVVVNGFKSKAKNITSGVPQGSHLGPILFGIFINDIPNIVKFSYTYLYADDLKICRTINNSDDSQLLQNDLDEIIQWCCDNDMDLNTNKCFYVQYTRKTNVINFQYRIDKYNIRQLDQVKDLGIIFDKKVTYLAHIDDVIKRASKMLGFVLRSAKLLRNIKTKILLYNCLVRSILEYCVVVWRPHYATHSLRIERIQKRFVRHLVYSAGIEKNNKRISYKDSLSYFNIRSLEDRREIIDLLFVSKIINSKIDCPQLLSKFNFRIPRRYPRHKITPLVVPLRKTVFGSNSPISRMCKVVNKYSDLFDICYDPPSKLHRAVTTHNT